MKFCGQHASCKFYSFPAGWHVIYYGVFDWSVTFTFIEIIIIKYHFSNPPYKRSHSGLIAYLTLHSSLLPLWNIYGDSFWMEIFLWKSLARFWSIEKIQCRAKNNDTTLKMFFILHCWYVIFHSMLVLKIK